MYRVLIADDNPLVGKSLLMSIPWKELNCESPRVVHDGDAARLEAEDWHPHIIISDIKMPGMDGLEFLKWSRQLFPDCPFIIITGFDEFHYAQKAIKLGASDLIIKPIDSRELINSLKTAVKSIKNCEKRENKDSKLKEQVKNLASDLRIKFYRDLLEDGTGVPPEEMYELNISQKREFLIIIGEQPKNGIIEKLQRLYGIEWDTFHYQKARINLLFCKRGNSGSPFNNLPGFISKWGNSETPCYSQVFTSILDLPQIYNRLKQKELSHKESPSAAPPLIHNPQVAGALKYMDENYKNKISLEDTANSLNISGAHLTRLLKRETGFGYNDLLSRLRIAQALLLLKKGDRGVSETGESVGLANYAHFYQVFKKITTYSPREFPYGDREMFRKYTKILRLFHGEDQIS